jgi:hypothetical protein
VVNLTFFFFVKKEATCLVVFDTREQAGIFLLFFEGLTITKKPLFTQLV